ncbi:MAG: FAD-dependent oxidoreductase [Pseudomonadota bacterium]
MSVDTGFIVFNYQNYPNLSKIFEHFNVAVQKSNMSFGVSANNGNFEWSAENLLALFGQWGNLFSPKFYQFLLDVLRFNNNAVKLRNKYQNNTLAEMIKDMGMGKNFAKYYILPMAGAIWSCSLDKILEFPAKTFIDFFDAHGLLSVTGQPQWYTVTGGSNEYIKRISADFSDKIITNCGIEKAKRENGKAQVTDSKGRTEEYDNVVFACHADQALAMLSDASEDEINILSKFKYQKNTAYLHKDIKQMPKRKRCWASWVYLANKNHKSDNITISYWMNHLQGIDKNYPLLLTLNPIEKIKEEDIFDIHEFEHPVYNLEMIEAQNNFHKIQGKNASWFCGAHLRYGFHEDGATSGMNVAKMLGAKELW